jgi:hypothetical protein
MNAEHTADIAKGIPPATVATLSIFGVSIPDYIQYGTVVYITCVCIQMLYRGTQWLLNRIAKYRAERGSSGTDAG